MRTTLLCVRERLLTVLSSALLFSLTATDPEPSPCARSVATVSCKEAKQQRSTCSVFLHSAPTPCSLSALCLFPACAEKSTDLLIRKLPFQRLVREIAQGQSEAAKTGRHRACNTPTSSCSLLFLALLVIQTSRTTCASRALPFWLCRRLLSLIWLDFSRTPTCQEHNIIQMHSL